MILIIQWQENLASSVISAAAALFLLSDFDHASLSFSDLMLWTGWKQIFTQANRKVDLISHRFRSSSLSLCCFFLHSSSLTGGCWRKQSAQRTPRARTPHKSIVSVSPCRLTYITACSHSDNTALFQQTNCFESRFELFWYDQIYHNHFINLFSQFSQSNENKEYKRQTQR